MNTKDIVYVALFSALTAALGLFPPLMVATGVPITAQSLGVMLAGAILGSRRGGLSMCLFLVLIAVGMPLLSGGRGGFGVLVGPSGGFLLAWPVAAFTIGYLVEKYWSSLTILTLFIFIFIGGIVIMYLAGIPWISVVAGISLKKAIIGSAAYIPGDIIKAGFAAYIAMTIKRSYPIINTDK